MATVAEILKQTGLTDEQIAALDAKAITAFTGIMTTADQAKADAVAAATKAEADKATAIAEKEKAELEKRSNVEFYETKIIPGLTGWEQERNKLMTDKLNAEAAVNFYKTQNDG